MLQGMRSDKCRRTVTGTGCFSPGKESSKGLNTESNNPQRASATALVEIDVGRHCRDEHTMLPRFRALLESKTPTSYLGCIVLLGEVTVQGELGELEVANNGYH